MHVLLNTKNCPDEDFLPVEQLSNCYESPNVTWPVVKRERHTTLHCNACAYQPIKEGVTTRVRAGPALSRAEAGGGKPATRSWRGEIEVFIHGEIYLYWRLSLGQSPQSDYR